MKRHLLHIALAGAALVALSGRAQAQVSPLFTPSLKLKDPGSVNSVTIGPPALLAPYTLTLPVNDGDAAQVLTTDGNGVLTWTTPSSGSGTLNYLAKFTSATTIGNSSIIDDGNLVSINTTGTGKTVLIGSAGTGSSVELVAGSLGVAIGTSAGAGTVTIGRTGGTITTFGTIGHTGTITSSGLITGNAGATVSGAAVSINDNSNFATTINTGTSTGAVTIGNAANTSNVTIATNSSTGRLVLSNLNVEAVSGTNDVLIINASNQVSRITQANLFGSSWQLTGNATTTAWNGTTGTRLGTTSAQPLVLATTNATAQDIAFYTGASGANERMRIAGATGLVTIQNALTVSGLITGSAGATISGAATSINASSNFATNINTGTSTGAVTIGNAANTSNVTIATNSSTGRLVLSNLNVEAVSGTNDVLIINASNQVSRITQANLFGSSWQLTGNATTTAWNGTTGTRLGTTSAQPLVLATTNATAQDIAFYTGASGANERMRIAGATGLVTIQNALTVSGLITGSAGATISGAATSINASSNFATNINTGTSTGLVSIGNSLSTTAIAGATGITGTTTINTAGNASTTIGNASTTGTTTIATNGTTGRLVVSGLPTVTTSDDVAVVNASNQVSRITQANLVSGGTIGGRVATATSAMSTLITDANVTANDIIMVTLETSTSGADIPVFTIVRAAGSFTVHFSAPFSGFVNYTITNK